MRIVKMIAVSSLASAVSLAAFAAVSEEVKSYSGAEGVSPGVPSMMYGQQSQMPMMGGQQGQMPMMRGQQGQMPMMQMMQMMQQRHAMMNEHMKKMEAHMANIEALLRQLVELEEK